MSSLKEFVATKSQLKSLAHHINQGFFSPYQQEMILNLLKDDQEHLFTGWDDPGLNDSLKQDFLASLEEVQRSYPSGLLGYAKNARALLLEASKGANSFAGFTPEKPTTIDLPLLDAQYTHYEEHGLQNLDKLAVVMVAGGLGERLGFSGIKINIAVESITQISYFAYYASVIKTIGERVGHGHEVPFIIMTSEQTHEKTLQSLKEHHYFGLNPDQVTILTQKLVPAISDNAGHFALDKNYKLVLKPHGHGDIHMLMHTSGTAGRLLKRGISHLVFIQDTNGQVFNAALCAFGVSLVHDFDFNSIAVRRIPKEAVGALVTLRNSTEALTLNVEYNQLDPLLRATVDPRGDVADSTGFSPFPGNINVLMVKLGTYHQILQKTEGIIAEFVNPKYADENRHLFKSPTRLETMMQDLPKLFGPKEKVGVTVFDRVWCFSANKNNLVDARKRHDAGGPPESAMTAESDFFLAGRMKLAAAGVQVATSGMQLIQGIPYTPGARVYLSPDFALGLSEIKDKITSCRIGGECTLYLKGREIYLDDVELTNGASLMITATHGAHVTVSGLRVDKIGHQLEPLSGAEVNDAGLSEDLRMHGLRYIIKNPMIFHFNQPGRYLINSRGEVERL